MSNAELRLYVRQMLVQLAELADAHTEDEELGRLAFELRMLAERSKSAPEQILPQPSAVH